MTRRATVLTIGKVTERGDLVRDFEDATFLSAETFLAQPSGEEVGDEVLFQVGDGEPEDLARQLVAAMQRAGIDSTRIYVEGGSDLGSGQRPHDAASTDSNGRSGSRKSERGAPLRARERARARRRKARRSKVGKSRARVGLKGRLRGLNRVDRFSGAVMVLSSLVVVWRTGTLVGDWLLAVFLLPILLAVSSATVLGLRLWRVTSRGSRTNMKTQRVVRSNRRAVREIRENLERLRVEHAKTAAAASLAVIAVDEHLRYRASRSETESGAAS